METPEVVFSILLPAFLAGLLVTATHVPLGRVVLQRGIIFLDLAIAQVAAFGLIVAYSFHWEPSSWQVQVIAMLAAIGGVIALYFTEQRWPDIQEALIGSLFVLASSGSILLLAKNPHGGEQLRELLVGQILWASDTQIISTAILYICVLIGWLVFRQKSSSLLFYLLFALSITASVQLVGVLLVFATLILPALAIRTIQRHQLIIGYAISTGAYLLGLWSSYMLDYPAGAVIIYCLAALALIVSSTATIINRKYS